MENDDLRVSINTSIIDTLKKMDAARHKVLLVFDDNNFVSIITIGDIQRAIIKDSNLNRSICSIVSRDNKDFANSNDTEELIKKKMLAIRCELMPVLDDNGTLTKIYKWTDFFGENDIKNDSLIDLPVVIMAGGKGTRLKPMTNVLPKPLIPLGDKTILEEIMDQFENIGCHNFYMSVNYKYDIIKYYLSQLSHIYNISFFKENKPLGTIGSVSLLRGKINTSFFVSNCDILIDHDYRDVYNYHKKNGNDITIVTAVKNIQIPYGVIDTTENGVMTGLREKPNLNYMINTGVYILEPQLINEIPDNEFFHITDLMNKVKKRGGKIGCFPVSEKSWTDIGDWKEYLKIINK